jgi:hypothetical protein
VADEGTQVQEADPGHGEHGGIHLPPPSFVPISVACALATTLVGFIDQVRNSVGPLVWGIGLVWLVASCAVWFRAARTEFNDLPDSIDSP